MSEPDDTPTHWVRDLLIGAAMVLAVVQTVRMSGSEGEITRLHAQLNAAERVQIVGKAHTPLAHVLSLERAKDQLVIHLAPVRAAMVDVSFFDTNGREVAGCSQTRVALAPEIRCSTPSDAVTAFVYEN